MTGLNEASVKTAVVDMTRAYSKGAVDRLVRTFTLDPESNRLTLTDEYSFSKRPKSLLEAFVTFEIVQVARGGQSVQIGPRGKGVSIRIEGAAGRFAVTALTEESKEGRTDKTIQRITFTPRTLGREMALTFVIE